MRLAEIPLDNGWTLVCSIAPTTTTAPGPFAGTFERIGGAPRVRFQLVSPGAVARDPRRPGRAVHIPGEVLEIDAATAAALIAMRPTTSHAAHVAATETP